jgi:hypothetical protein
MQRLSVHPYPVCHMGHVPGPAPGEPVRRVWICEYPYRTVRLQAPSAECCGDCPVWHELEAARRRAAVMWAEAQAHATVA